MLLALTIGLLPMAPALGWAVLPLALAGAATVYVEGALTETIQDGVPDAARAGVLGLTDSVMVGAALVGSLVAPWLAATLGARGLLLLLAAMALAGALPLTTGLTHRSLGHPGSARPGRAHPGSADSVGSRPEGVARSETSDHRQGVGWRAS